MKIKLTVLLILIALYGNAQEKLSAVILTHNPSTNAIPDSQLEKYLQQHLKHATQHYQEGKILLHSSLKNKGVLLLLNTHSAIEAKQWLQADSAIANGIFNVEIYPITLRVGGICKGTDQPATTSYSAINFMTHITKFNVRQVPQLLKTHDDHLVKIEARGAVLLEGYYENTDGGLLIVKGDIDPSVLQADPTVQSGFIQPTLYPIQFNLGSPCE